MSITLIFHLWFKQVWAAHFSLCNWFLQFDQAWKIEELIGACRLHWYQLRLSISLLTRQEFLSKMSHFPSVLDASEQIDSRLLASSTGIVVLALSFYQLMQSLKSVLYWPFQVLESDRSHPWCVLVYFRTILLCSMSRLYAEKQSIYFEICSIYSSYVAQYLRFHTLWVMCLLYQYWWSWMSGLFQLPN